MKIIMFGAQICPDCVEAKEILSKYPQHDLDYRDITKDTKTLKEFLSHRDHDELFKEVIQDGRIGIPFFLLDDGTKTLDISDFIEINKSTPSVNACSIDGKGSC